MKEIKVFCPYCGKEKVLAGKLEEGLNTYNDLFVEETSLDVLLDVIPNVINLLLKSNGDMSYSGIDPGPRYANFRT